MSFTLMASAQASGGQIKRSTPKQRAEVKKRSMQRNNATQAKQSTPTYIPPAIQPASFASHSIQMPQFPGGPQALFEYLSNNINYPLEAEKKGIQGRVTVDFIVEADGSISEPCVKKSVDINLDSEAIRVVKNMPKWIPGKENGHPVRVKYYIPITFKL